MIIKDDFISSFNSLKKHVSTLDFNKEVNGVDGAVYPAISFEIPNVVKAEFIKNIETEVGFKINPLLVFLRANPLGEKEPYQAHNDLNMGKYTCILYLTDKGGTSFLEHIQTGMSKNDPDFIDEWFSDCNDYDKWNITDYCPMKPNRALLFDAELMHRGEPCEGYGKGNKSRMIMVCFYDKATNDT